MTERDEGFTLVEVLIAVALLGMLTTLAYGAIRFGSLFWRHVAERRDADAERDALVRILRQAVRGAYPAFAATDYADRRISFDGSSGQLALITALPEAIEAGITARERFSLTTNSGLSMQWALDLNASGGGALPMYSVQLAADIAAIRFMYFGSSAPHQSPAWVHEWTGMLVLPELVRAQVWRRGISTKPWIDLTIETSTTTNVDCAYVPQEPVCRRVE